MARKVLSLVALAALLASPAAGFDSYWHSECTQKAGESVGFSEDAWKITQIGNFSPDLFGPVAEYASKNLGRAELQALNNYQQNNQQVRDAAIYLHFDNLNGELQRNSDLDYLFSSLLKSTQGLLRDFGKLNVDQRTRKVLTLVTLGASLHAVQDFYSHSDWVHNDFDKTDVKMVRLPSGDVRAPTWFEFRSEHNDPSHWPFRVQSGIYPPVADAPNTHTHMNHDNSRLRYRELETPGQPVVLQAPFHDAGPVPARGDEVSDLAHQQLAVQTAAAASIEWISKVEEDAGARKAIEAAKTWNLKLQDPHLATELKAGIITEMAVSCAAGKWDGDDPPGDRGVLCRSVLERKMNPVGSTSGSEMIAEIIGLAANLATPYALKFTGMFWDVHTQYHVLERLAQEIGSGTGHYRFVQRR